MASMWNLARVSDAIEVPCGLHRRKAVNLRSNLTLNPKVPCLKDDDLPQQFVSISFSISGARHALCDRSQPLPSRCIGPLGGCSILDWLAGALRRPRILPRSSFRLLMNSKCSSSFVELRVLVVFGMFEELPSFLVPLN